MSQVSEDDTDVDAPTARGALFMVDRAHLVASLARHVEEELSGSVSLHWGAPLASLDAAAQVVRFGEMGEEEQERRYDLLVACDGGSSAARRALEEAGLIEITELPSPVSLTDYKTFHGEEVFFFLGNRLRFLSRARDANASLFPRLLSMYPLPPPRNFSLSIRSRRRRRRRARSRHHWPRLHLCDVCSPSSPAGSEGSHVRFLALRFLAFPGGGGEEARQIGDEKLTSFSTASLPLAPSLSPPFHTQKKNSYPGSMAVHRRPGGKGWSGLLSQPPGVFEPLAASLAPPSAYAPLLDGVLGVQAPGFPASWRDRILAQLAAAPGSEGGGDVGRLAKLLRASALAVPAAGVALVGDAATTNTPQLGQGAASAIEDAAALAAEVTRSLVESEKEEGEARKRRRKRADGGGGAAADADAADASARRTKAAVARGLEAYDSKRRRARYALQDMERELAVTNRPPPIDESPEDAEARAAWKSFFDEGKRRAAKRSALKRAVSRLLPFSRRARAAAHVSEMSWWNEALHSTTP